MAVDHGSFGWPARSWRRIILAAALSLFLPDQVIGQCEGIFKDGFEPGLVINEVDYDNPGTDLAEFVEVFNAGTAPIPLAGILLQLADSAATVYKSVALPVFDLPAGDYFVVGTLAVPNVDLAFFGPAPYIQNGPADGLFLWDTMFCVPLDRLAYEGPVPGLVEGNALPATVADSNTAPGSLIRNPNGFDSNDAAADWIFTSSPTPGSANTP